MEKTLEKIVALAKSRGFVYPGSEIYGGLANTWDYGNIGVELKNNVKKAWWQKFVQENPYNVGVDCAILMNPQTWVASGHLGGFSDPLMDCKECHERFRADKLIEGLNDLNTGAGSRKDGLVTLEDGMGQLKNGAKDLKNGLNAADQGAQALSDGSKELVAGAKSLESGASELSAGLHTLYKGSGELVNGVSDLDSGAKEMKKGMKKSKEEGIDKVSYLLGDDLKALLESIEGLRDNAKAYRNFSASSEDMNGSVKFIFVTE